MLRWLEEGGTHISKVHAVSLGDGERGLRALDSIRSLLSASNEQRIIDAFVTLM